MLLGTGGARLLARHARLSTRQAHLTVPSRAAVVASPTEYQYVEEPESWRGASGLIGSQPKPYLVPKKGMNLLHEPLFNKGVRFPDRERDRLSLRGLLPPKVLSTRQQVTRFLKEFRAADSMIAKYTLLSGLQDRNETLFFKVLSENIIEMAPVVYTPTVGEACQKFSAQFRRPRGMYFSIEDRGEMCSMLYNWPFDEVDVVVVTDGSRILGLGDLGVQGMGISIGKLNLYVACGGLSPARVLPVCLDVGTDNMELQNDPAYLGLNRPRATGDEYYAVVDEFMSALTHRYPNGEFDLHYSTSAVHCLC